MCRDLCFRTYPLLSVSFHVFHPPPREAPVRGFQDIPDPARWALATLTSRHTGKRWFVHFLTNPPSAHSCAALSDLRLVQSSPMPRTPEDAESDPLATRLPYRGEGEEMSVWLTGAGIHTLILGSSSALVDKLQTFP